MIPLFTDDCADWERQAIERLYELEEWPQEWDKDLALVRRMAEIYESIDVAEQAALWVTWMDGFREKHPRKEVKHRHRFANWCRNADRYQSRRSRSVQHRSAATAEEHGQSGVSKW